MWRGNVYVSGMSHTSLRENPDGRYAKSFALLPQYELVRYEYECPLPLPACNKQQRAARIDSELLRLKSVAHETQEHSQTLPAAVHCNLETLLPRATPTRSQDKAQQPWTNP